MLARKETIDRSVLGRGGGGSVVGWEVVITIGFGGGRLGAFTTGPVKKPTYEIKIVRLPNYMKTNSFLLISTKILKENTPSNTYHAICEIMLPANNF